MLPGWSVDWPIFVSAGFKHPRRVSGFAVGAAGSSREQSGYEKGRMKSKVGQRCDGGKASIFLDRGDVV